MLAVGDTAQLQAEWASESQLDCILVQESVQEREQEWEQELDMADRRQVEDVVHKQMLAQELTDIHNSKLEVEEGREQDVEYSPKEGQGLPRS